MDAAATTAAATYEFLPVDNMTCSEDFKKRIVNLFIKINLVSSFLTNIKNHRDNLSRFGLKDSHTLRAHFMALAQKAQLHPDAIMWVYLFCAKARTKDRIKSGIKTAPTQLRNDPHFAAAAQFVDTRMVTWPDQETDEKFATVHLPNTNPGLAYLMMSLTGTSMTVEEFLTTSWAPQIHWADSMEGLVRERSRHFWTKVVTHTTHAARRTKRDEDSRFNEGIFETQWKDQYPLVSFSRKTGEIRPSKETAPYDRKALETYLEWANTLKDRLEEIVNPKPTSRVASKRRSTEMDTGEATPSSPKQPAMETEDPTASTSQSPNE